jgi:hypothetical protein
LGAFVASQGARAARADGVYGVKAELGVEHDSNPARTETIPDAETPTIVPSPAGRFVLGGNAAWRLGRRWSAVLSARGASRTFVRGEARQDDVLIAQGSGALSVAVGPAVITGSFGYYDAFQRRQPAARDFRTLSPGTRLDVPVGDGTLSVGGGYRWFTFKPAGALDFHGPSGLVSYRHTFWGQSEDEDDAADWDLFISAGIEQRQFASDRCLKPDDCPPLEGTGARQDTFSTAGFEVARTGAFLTGIGGAVHHNVSNSYGDSLLRLALHLKAGVALPWELMLSGRAELLVTRYAESLPLGRGPVAGLPLLSVEDESRSTLRVELARLLGPRWDLVARYVLFADAFGGGPDYLRQTFLLSVEFSYD